MKASNFEFPWSLPWVSPQDEAEPTFTWVLPWDTSSPEVAVAPEEAPSDGSWEEMPDELDPRFDSHGFRRDPRNLEREEAFATSYAPRLDQQEQRWGRHTGLAEERARVAIPMEELKRLVRLGIPARRRGKLWPQLARADELRATEADDYYASLLSRPAASPGEAGFAAERQVSDGCACAPMQLPCCQSSTLAAPWQSLAPWSCRWAPRSPLQRARARTLARPRGPM